jgi:hypothetical protein
MLRSEVVGCNVGKFGRRLPTSRRNLLRPSSLLQTDAAGYSEMLASIYRTTQHNIPEDRLLEAAGSSETVVPIHQITWRHIPQDSNLGNPYFSSEDRFSQTHFLRLCIPHLILLKAQICC